MDGPGSKLVSPSRVALASLILPVVLVAAAELGDRGEELWQRGARAEAVEIWVQELEKSPADRELRRRLVEAELEIHRYNGVLEHGRELGDEARGARGRALYKLGRFAEALEELPRETSAELEMRVDALEVLQRHAEADREAEWLERLDAGRSAQVAAILGRVARRRGDREAAQRHFRRALELDPVEPTALFGLGTLLSGGERDAEGLALLQRHRKVTPLIDRLDFAQRSVDLAPMHGPNHAGVGDAQRALGRLDAAEAAYARAAALCRPDELASVALRHARLLSEDRKDATRAVALLEAAHARCKDVRLLVRAGDVLAEAGDPAGARSRYELALAERPDDKEIRARLERLKESR